MTKKLRVKEKKKKKVGHSHRYLGTILSRIKKRTSTAILQNRRKKKGRVSQRRLGSSNARFGKRRTDFSPGKGRKKREQLQKEQKKPARISRKKKKGKGSPKGGYRETPRTSVQGGGRTYNSLPIAICKKKKIGEMKGGFTPARKGVLLILRTTKKSQKNATVECVKGSQGRSNQPSPQEKTRQSKKKKRKPEVSSRRKGA